LETDSLEVETATHLALIADALDRPLSELKELNPGLLKSVAPAGFKVNVPKGTLPLVETAFAVVPAAKRDAWRLHRVAQGDSFATLAKRYSAQTASISLANREGLPEAGSLVAIPVPYPGDRVPAAKASVSKRHTAAPAVASALKQKKSVSKLAPKAPAPKASAAKSAAKKTTAVAQKSASKAPVRHTASLHVPNS
jgi:hypothetical protein